MLETEKFTIFGPIFEAEFVDKTFHLYYEDKGEGNAELTLTQIRGSKPGNTLILQARVVELRPRLYMVTWQEPNMETVTESDHRKKE